MHKITLKMQTILSNIIISVNDNLYVKTLETSELGKKIIQHSIILIDEIGFEFTFKKLGEKKINSTKVLYTTILKANTN